MVSLLNCSNINKEKISMNNSLENIFGPKLFFPYTIMEFKLSAEKSTKSNFAKALIVIVESD
jgi:hypothetical protein